MSALSSQVGSNEDIRNVLIDKLQDDDWQVRQSAVSALSSQVGSDEDIRNALIDKLQDDDWQVRQSAVSALSSQVGSDEDIRNALINKLKDDHYDVRGAALRSLASLLLTRARALDVFEEQRRTEYWQARRITAEVVGEHSTSGEHFELIQKILRETNSREAAPFLAGCLEASEPLVCAHASIRNLSFLSLQHRYWEVRQSAVSALSS